jgi:hypothetical protein
MSECGWQQAAQLAGFGARVGAVFRCMLRSANSCQMQLLVFQLLIQRLPNQQRQYSGPVCNTSELTNALIR